MTRRKVLVWILVYLVIGYLVNVMIFFASNPGYLRAAQAACHAINAP